MHGLWADEVEKSKLHPSFATIFSLWTSARHFWKAPTRWCIHLRPKIEIYGDYNVRWYKSTFAWRRAFEIQGHGVVGLLLRILE